MEVVLTDTEGISNGVYHLIPNVCYKDRLEPKGTNGIILKGTKSRSLRYNNIYKRC